MLPALWLPLFTVSKEILMYTFENQITRQIGYTKVHGLEKKFRFSYNIKKCFKETEKNEGKKYINIFRERERETVRQRGRERERETQRLMKKKSYKTFDIFTFYIIYGTYVHVQWMFMYTSQKYI